MEAEEAVAMVIELGYIPSFLFQFSLSGGVLQSGLIRLLSASPRLRTPLERKQAAGSNGLELGGILEMSGRRSRS